MAAAAVVVVEEVATAGDGDDIHLQSMVEGDDVVAAAGTPVPVAHFCCLRKSSGCLVEAVVAEVAATEEVGFEQPVHYEADFGQPHLVERIEDT